MLMSQRPRRLLFVIAFLVGSMAAAHSASAGQHHEFTSTANATVVTGQGTNHTFSMSGMTITCNTATFSETRSGTSIDEATLHPTFSG